MYNYLLYIIEILFIQVILLPNLNIDHHQSKYTCLVSNIIGESSDSIILNVTCKLFSFCIIS